MYWFQCITSGIGYILRHFLVLPLGTFPFRGCGGSALCVCVFVYIYIYIYIYIFAYTCLSEQFFRNIYDFFIFSKVFLETALQLILFKIMERWSLSTKKIFTVNVSAMLTLILISRLSLQNPQCLYKSPNQCANRSYLPPRSHRQ